MIISSELVWMDPVSKTPFTTQYEIENITLIQIFVKVIYYLQTTVIIVPWHIPNKE